MASGVKIKKRKKSSAPRRGTRGLQAPSFDNWEQLDGKQFHIPADGNAHIVDTTKMHTALNASKQDRIHIVGALRV